MQKSGNIPVLSNLDISLFEKEYIQKCKPAIIKGAIKNWPAFTKWDTQYLVNKVGNVSVKFKHADSSIFPNPDTFDSLQQFNVQEITFKEYINLLIQDNKHITQNKWVILTADEACFIRNGIPNNKFDTITEDFLTPPFIPSQHIEDVGLWVSKKGTASSIHYDSNACHNFNAQITGSKRVILFDPNESKNLYINPISQKLLFYNFSKVNWRKPDYNKFPNLKYAKYIDGILEPGDALFIPIFWLHCFDHVGDMNINVNFWWHPENITLNAVTLSWLLGIASSQMLSNYRNEQTSNTGLVSNRHLASKDALYFLQKLEAIFYSWNNGRPEPLR